MARLRRAPRQKPPQKVKACMPLHQRILGKGQVELDTVEDLRYKLEQYKDNDAIEYDTYLQCHEALDIREAKAKESLAKATGRYSKPETVIDVKRQSHKHVKGLKRWQVKVLCVFVFLIVWKFISFKP